MNSILRLNAVRPLAKASLLRQGLGLLAGAALLLSMNQAPAAFHLWRITEVYSSADGSVQFVEFTNNNSFGGQNALNGLTITCSGSQGTHTYTFPANLPSSGTQNRAFVIGTTNLALVPGGVPPDYVFNSAPFLFLDNGAANTINYASGTDSVAYTNLPSDGSSSLVRSGSGLMLSSTNSARNFANGSNTIVPLRFSSSAKSGTNALLTFATATGTNGTAGPNYAVQTNASLSSVNWGTLTNVAGNGATKTVSDSLAAASVRFYRLRVP